MKFGVRAVIIRDAQLGNNYDPDPEFPYLVMKIDSTVTLTLPYSSVRRMR
jgi:hypothetical protein